MNAFGRGKSWKFFTFVVFHLWSQRTPPSLFVLLQVGFDRIDPGDSQYIIARLNAYR